jgi:hypothetical protein
MVEQERRSPNQADSGGRKAALRSFARRFSKRWGRRCRGREGALGTALPTQGFAPLPLDFRELKPLKQPSKKVWNPIKYALADFMNRVNYALDIAVVFAVFSP